MWTLLQTYLSSFTSEDVYIDIDLFDQSTDDNLGNIITEFMFSFSYV